MDALTLLIHFGFHTDIKFIKNLDFKNKFL